MKKNRMVSGIIAFFVILVVIGASGCTFSSGDDDDDDNDNDVNDLIAVNCAVNGGSAQSDNGQDTAVSLVESTYDSRS
ncbi:MAG: hypothetical protein HZC47_10305 [Methanobacterium sp.]|uniref:hypothetical protein n=1 Tax=Methanobacterium sp. TaxID=2164 RepID=UPI003D64C771|nr:hypothetical protein [Methanobacterium sp.]